MYQDGRHHHQVSISRTWFVLDQLRKVRTKLVVILTERIDFTRDESLIWLSKGDKDMSILIDLNQVLWILSPEGVVLWCVLQRCTT